MKLSVRTLLMVLLVVAAGVAVLRPSEKGRVRKAFANAGHVLSKDGPESPIATALRAQEAASLVCPFLHFVVPEMGMDLEMAQEDVRRNAAALRMGSERIRFSFEDLQVEITEPGRASVTADALVSGSSQALGAMGRDVRSVEVLLEKDVSDGKWRFREVRVLPIVSR
jgi:hypothetical protein